MHTELLLVGGSRGNFPQNPAHDLACACMCVCMHVCMYACMHVRVWLYVCVRVRVWLYLCVRVCVWLYLCVRVRVWLYLCVRVRVWLYLCVRVWVQRADTITTKKSSTQPSFGPWHSWHRMHSSSRRAITCTLGVIDRVGIPERVLGSPGALGIACTLALGVLSHAL